VKKSRVRKIIAEEVKKALDLVTSKTPEEDFDPEQLKKGTEVEKEHTTDDELAAEIAKVHLDEDPKYYPKLEKLEKS